MSQTPCRDLGWAARGGWFRSSWVTKLLKAGTGCWDRLLGPVQTAASSHDHISTLCSQLPKACQPEVPSLELRNKDILSLPRHTPKLACGSAEAEQHGSP